MGYTKRASAKAAAPRKAVHVESEIKSANLKRLARIEGQVRGLAAMVEDERYCGDILVQITSVEQALRGVSRELLRNHIRHCAESALRGSPKEARVMLDELVDLFHRRG